MAVLRSRGKPAGHGRGGQGNGPQDPGSHQKDPKTFRSRRKVDLSYTMLAILEDLRRRRKEEWLAKGQNEIPEWVFSNRRGEPADMNNVK
jgi:hypothetical protein